MVLTITTTHKPATDLGFLLHKNPERLHEAELSFGKAYVFYPERNEDRCTAAVLLDIDPIALVRSRRGGSSDGGLFGHYVNDRPYVASSFLSSALTEFFSTAMSGRSKERKELADSEIWLECHLPVVPCRGEEAFLTSLFEPLGYEIELVQLPLQKRFPEWGTSRYFDVTLRKQCRIRDLLNHVYVLLPVLDDEKHYYVGKQEIDKLLLRGGDWLNAHPHKEEIVKRYLKRQRHLTREALERLAERDGHTDPDEADLDASLEENVLERPLSLHDQRLNTVFAALKESGARRVLDLGCGEGRLLKLLINEKQFAEVVGMDVAWIAIERAESRLNLERMPPMKRQRLRLIHGSLVYRDKRLKGYDAAAVVEVIEHLDEARLKAFERNLFEFARPTTVVVTTPNSEYNVLFETLPVGKMRHRDHRFEWTRAQFETWALGVCERHGYEVKFSGVGPADDKLGAASQMAVFRIR